ncbi:MAG: DUF1249 domain-containing protein [Gammaproteobacteria bacterium]
MCERPYVPTMQAPARSLAGLIDLYERNYIRLMRLVPELRAMQGTTVSRVVDALDLYLTVIERSKYTTGLVLTYQFQDGDEVFAEPNARIRVYHDARAVEVVSQTRRRRPAIPARRWRPDHMPELDRKWELNRFLYKWLGFCQRQGHIFLRCITVATDPPRHRFSQTLLQR